MTTDRTDYEAYVTSMTDDELVKETETKCWLSAYAANNPRSDNHWKTDVLYAEAKRRNKPWLYNRGWNAAWVSAGYELSDHDIEAARAI